jgi:amino acid transporter
VSTALFKVFHSYASLENANNVMNEVKNPIRTLKVITLSALTTACVLYLLVNIADFLVITLDRIRDGGELVAALFFEAVFGPTVSGKLLSVAVALSTAGNVMVVMFALAQVKQEIARQGFLPFSNVLSSTKPFGTPLGRFTVHYIPTFLVIVLPPSKEVYSFILEVEGYPAQIISLAVGIGLLWLRHKWPDIKRPFKAWIPAVLLRLVLSLALLAAPLFPPEHVPEGSICYATYAIVGVGM